MLVAVTTKFKVERVKCYYHYYEVYIVRDATTGAHNVGPVSTPGRNVNTVATDTLPIESALEIGLRFPLRDSNQVDLV